MEVIHVPPPPREAFNKSRPMSDLIKAQVQHFKHLEYKLSPEERQSIPQHRVITENDAAQYIAAMTRFLRSGVTEAASPRMPLRMKAKAPAEKASSQGLSLAASESISVKAAKSKSKSRRKKTKK